jgi:putative aldouronate transport system substrate-binding protein
MVDGEPEFLDEVVNSEIGFTNEMFKIGALHYAIPQVLTEAGRSAIFAGAKDIWPRAAEIYETAEPVFVTALPTPAESRTINSMMADIDTYVQEQVVKFIRGDRPLSEFDSFAATLRTMGIEEVIEMKQIQYERFLEN